MKTAMKSPPTTFRKPPVNEVVVATYFNPPLSDLRSEHIGLFWQEIKEDFPVAKQHLPVPNIELPSDEPFPMPRYWFIADNKINLVQVQKHAFIFNWRRRNEDYPGFHKGIKPAFDKYYGVFSEFVRTQVNTNPVIDLCELTYINTIEQAEYWADPQDTVRLIPSFSILPSGAEDSDFLMLRCNYVHDISNDLQLNIGIHSGATQQGTPVLRFEIKASGRLGQVAKPRTDEWFGRAHDAIVRCFLDITRPDIRNEFWEPVE